MKYLEFVQKVHRPNSIIFRCQLLVSGGIQSNLLPLFSHVCSTLCKLNGLAKHSSKFDSPGRFSYLTPWKWAWEFECTQCNDRSSLIECFFFQVDRLESRLLCSNYTLGNILLASVVAFQIEFSYLFIISCNKRIAMHNMKCASDCDWPESYLCTSGFTYSITCYI